MFMQPDAYNTPDDPLTGLSAQIPDREHVMQLLATPGTPVFDDEGNRLGTVSDHKDTGALVIKRTMLAPERELVVPLSAVAGASDDAIFLLFQQDELTGYHKAGTHHQKAMTLGSSLAQEMRPPKEDVQAQVQRNDIAKEGDATGHHPG